MTLATILSVALVGTALADKPEQKKAPPGLAKKGGVPPGLAKKGGLPPGLAKKFGERRPEKAYVAVDPHHDDRAWFLIEGRWVLKEGFGGSLRAEVMEIRTRKPAPPPVPLPDVGAELHVVLFE
jgi:hypothetical protein